MVYETRKNSTYVYGNTAPAYSPEIEQENLAESYRIKKRRLEEEEERRRRLRARRALAREKKATRLNIIMMSFATLFILCSCALYIQLNSKLNACMNEVAQLEGEVINLTAENDSIEKRIETSIDLDKIKKQATKKLGMVYPSEDQIKYYSIDNNDYMEQYNDIPTGNKNSFFKRFFNK